MEFSGKEEGETAKDARGQKLKDPKLEFYILAELIPPSQLLWARLRTVLYHTISDIMIYQRRGRGSMGLSLPFQGLDYIYVIQMYIYIISITSIYV